MNTEQRAAQRRQAVSNLKAIGISRNRIWHTRCYVTVQVATEELVKAAKAAIEAAGRQVYISELATTCWNVSSD